MEKRDGRTILLKLSLLSLPVLAVLFLLGVPRQAGAQDTQNFSFSSFSGDYYLSRASDKSSRLQVDETLVAKFPNFDQNHGILRAIPQRYKGHTLSLQVSSVTDGQGRSYHYTTYDSNDNLVLKIGDPDIFVRGSVIYRIKYSYKDVISFEPGFDEFYWDINGDQWPQTFSKVTAHIHLAKDLPPTVLGSPACTFGFFGSLASNCDVEQKSTTLITASAQDVKPYQTLTFSLKFQKATFEPSPAIKQEELIKKIAIVSAAILIAILPISAFIFMFRRWRAFGDDPKGRGVIIPQYEQPKGLDVLSADFLFKQKLRPQAISARLIELAVSGYIDIYEIPKKGLFGKTDYELEVKKDLSKLSAADLKVLRALFTDITVGTKLKLSAIKKDTVKQIELHEQMEKLEDHLAADMHTRGYFIKNPHTVKRGYVTWATIILIAGFGGIFLAVSQKLALSIFFGGLAAALILMALVIYAFALIMPARSQQGVEDYDVLLGLRDYIKLAEAERIRYLQSPEGAEKIQDPDRFDPKTKEAKIKLFEELLPYAMLFGLEKKWAASFADIYTTPPSWYHGNMTAFNVGYLGSSMSDFGKAGNMSFSTPSSSGSGGGAGGGGGGGGGGGW